MSHKRRGKNTRLERAASDPRADSPASADPRESAATSRDSSSPPVLPPQQPTFPIVGIGASAGGVESLKRFFSTMPKDSGLAFVLVPHLDPTHKSLMVELLSKQTEMTVLEAKEDMAIEPDHVYIIPPNRYLSLEQGRFKLETPPEGRPMAIAIDGFFRSLAADQGDRAIGIILSGTGSHGVVGLREIKLAGGMVVAQRPDTADFDQMPRAAISAGLVDSSLPPEEMPRAIVEFVKLFYRNRRSEPDGESELEQHIEAQMAPILALLRSQTKADFRHYRKKMLLRRILRRMGLRQIEHVADYRALLLRDSAEVSALYKDMLIGVTNFFREAETFEVLERSVIPELAERNDGGPIRAWIPACSTGEEAYSLAMLLIEGLSAAKQAPSVQIFATDIDDDSLEVVRQGIYSESIAADVSPQRLQRFFSKTGDHHYKVTKQLREMILFAPQNLISDPPYSKLDIVSCRNLLIYLSPEMQQKVIPLFHFVLKEGGTLVLGQSESVGRMTDLFEPISRKWRVFRRIGKSQHERVEIPILPDSHSRASFCARNWHRGQRRVFPS